MLERKLDQQYKNKSEGRNYIKDIESIQKSFVNRLDKFMNITKLILLLAATGLSGVILGYILRWLITLSQKGSIELTIKQTLLEAKDKAQKLIDAADKEAAKKVEEAKQKEKEKELELKKKEDHLIKKDENLDKRQADIDKEIENIKKKIEEIKEIREKTKAVEEEK